MSVSEHISPFGSPRGFLPTTKGRPESGRLANVQLFILSPKSRSGYPLQLCASTPTPTSPGNVVRKSHLSKTLSSGWVLLRSLGGHEDRWCRSPARQIVGVEVQNGRVVECGHRDTATDPRGPQGLNPVGCLVARGEAAGVGFGRRRRGRATTTSNCGIARKSIPSLSTPWVIRVPPLTLAR